MILHKVIEIDLAPIREHAGNPEIFTPGDSARLLEFYSAFERGEFENCRKMTTIWGRAEGEHYPLKECVDEKVWDILLDDLMGSKYVLPYTVCA